MSGKIPFIPPEYNVEAFNCPHCNAYAHQRWARLDDNEGLLPNSRPLSKISICRHCNAYCLWHKHAMIYPESPGVPPPNSDLDKDIQQDYREAASIMHKSPRAAAALLRLAVQKLCRQLGEKGENLNHDIGNLVKKNLPPIIQKALDTVRVIGNDAVHPGVMDLEDDKKTVTKLFGLVNFIAEKMITEPREIDEEFGDLPKSKREQISQRDEKNEIPL